MSIAAVSQAASNASPVQRIAAIQARFSVAPSSSTTASATGASTSATEFASLLAAATGSSGSLGSTTLADVLAEAIGQLAGTSTNGATTGATGSGSQVVEAAQKYLGVPYRWGGTDPATGLDCSGLVQRVYRDLGIELPRVSRDQARQGTPVASIAEARPGDLVAFGEPVDHIAIYVGDNKILHAPRTGEVVKVTDIHRTPTAIRRIVPDTAATGGVAGFGGGAAGASGIAASTPQLAQYSQLFAQAGAKYGIDPEVLAAVAKVESGGNPNAVSSAGASGLMQFMPGTARAMGINPLDPAQAIDGAARLLVQQRNEFGSLELALAAYNAGGGAVRRAGGIPPYGETQAYVTKVMGLLGGRT